MLERINDGNICLLYFLRGNRVFSRLMVWRERLMEGFLSGVWFGILICLSIECMLVGLWYLVTERRK